MNVYKNIAELVGNTPIVKLSRVTTGLKSDIYAKLEFFNPSNSVKDRAALNMIVEGEKSNLINKDTTIIEATSGNTGIALATICAARGYKLILVIPDTMSIDKIHHIEALGAKVVLTPGLLGMKKAFSTADELMNEYENSFQPRQINNPANPGIHMNTTAVEIWEDMEGNIDFFVAASGTGGTVCGAGKKLKELSNNKISVVAVEPAGSPVLSGGTRGPHKIQGVGPGFIPATTDVSLFDRIICVEDDDALTMARRLARTEGIFAGISSGAAVTAAIKIAQEVENKNIVVIIPDTGERYLNTELYDEKFKDVFVS